MDKLVEHDEKFTLKPFGLHNVGNICWFNSLLQALFSLTAINKRMLDFQSAFTEKNNVLSSMYSSIIEYELKNPSENNTKNHSLGILKILIPQAKNKHISFSQCSASEGFVTLIDMFKCYNIFNMFLNRFKHRINCPNCNKTVSVTEDESCQIELFDNYNPKNEDDFTKYLLNHTSTIDSYTCDICKQTFKNITKYTSIVMLHEIIVVIFNKYNNTRNVKWFPQHMQFTQNDDSQLHYNIVASIEHFGTLNSGHYVANAKRNDKYYRFNDASVSLIDKIEPTPNTYMIMYALNHIKTNGNYV
jgi:ubiquitin C-terminal hydrolase